ncbi:MAG TPA: hypothetical protein VMZ28_15265 [Kofleriaceae bacterium]|nr:hypothetical protein [Kofleriaceae bacterium]
MRAHIRTILGLAVALGACAAPLEDPARFQEGATGTEDDACADLDVELDVLAPSCGGSACHGADGPAAGLDLATPGVAARLSGTASSCGEMLLVAPGDPDASLLYVKLEPEPPCGSQMPLGGEPLDEVALGCVRDWIAGLP